MVRRRLVTRFYDEVANGGHDEVLDEITTGDFVIHDAAPGERAGADAVRLNLATLRAGLSGLHFDLADVVEDGERTAARWVMRGTHTGDLYGQPATGREVEMSGMVFYRIAGDRLAEQWVLVDTQRLFRAIAA